jgi:hypothetical protein
MKLIFVNDSLLSLTHTYRCPCLDPDVKDIKQICTYKTSGDSIFVKNIRCKGDPCKFDPKFNIPIQDCRECWFLSAKAREQDPMNYIGPYHYTGYDKFGVVPQIDVDTFYFSHKRIFIIKEIPCGGEKDNFRPNKLFWILAHDPAKSFRGGYLMYPQF